MKKKLHDERQNYERSTLEDNVKNLNPLILFDKWFEEASNSPQIPEAHCMTISTCADAIPTNRVVLMKEYSSDGIVFFTNYYSKKGMDIENNPEVCLSFFWPPLERQVILNGLAQKVSAQESNAYFDSRPKDSQIAAIISSQSETVENKEQLEYLFKSFKDSGNEIQRPKNWGGYNVKPYRIEFWQGRPNRLHDRIVFTLNEEGTWKARRLFP